MATLAGLGDAAGMMGYLLGVDPRAIAATVCYVLSVLVIWPGIRGEDFRLVVIGGVLLALTATVFVATRARR